MRGRIDLRTPRGMSISMDTRLWRSPNAKAIANTRYTNEYANLTSGEAKNSCTTKSPMRISASPVEKEKLAITTRAKRD